MRNDTSNPNECKITSWPGGWLTAHRHRRTAAVLTSLDQPGEGGP
jgi:hypothetical protein